MSALKHGFSPVEEGVQRLSAHLRLQTGQILDQAAYIENWMSILRSDERTFFNAAAQAQLAFDWLLDKSPAPGVSDVPT